MVSKSLPAIGNAKERSIVFSAPLVRALLDGAKTQTRRILKDAHAVSMLDYWESKYGNPATIIGASRFVGAVFTVPSTKGLISQPLRCPYGVPGDRLWVREAFLPPNCVACDVGLPELGGCVCGSLAAVEYQATSERAGLKGWKSAIFMPRWSSRITLEIVTVRVDRLQNISAEDAIAEGIDPKPHLCDCDVCTMTSALCTATQSSIVLSYAELWKEINGDESWDVNPWIWAVEFRRIKTTRQPINAEVTP